MIFVLRRPLRYSPFPDRAARQMRHMRKRTRNGDPHTVPLTWLMCKVLAGVPKGGSLSSLAMSTALEAIRKL